jgi:hypothetical protein
MAYISCGFMAPADDPCSTNWSRHYSCTAAAAAATFEHNLPEWLAGLKLLDYN